MILNRQYPSLYILYIHVSKKSANDRICPQNQKTLCILLSLPYITLSLSKGIHVNNKEPKP